ncbi:MAG: O-antigen ligase family protein [Candidatus Peribacteraceae bacterium]|nr:O-antigen ligase family protein [Candidatus Peribacteraceae bacterium]MDD5075172.1 O-antigen ligase family protein [Candidatus Peribacteraceae bacterium]
MLIPPIRCLRSCSWQKVAVGLLLLLLAVSVFWKGGKTLETTWLLVGVAWLLVAVRYFKGPEKEERGVPLVLWGLVILFVFWTIDSFFLSSVGNYGLDEVFRTVSLSLLFFWTVRQPPDSRVRLSILKVLAASALLACAVGIVIYVVQPLNRFVGTFFDPRFHTDFWPNAWAEFVLLTWPVVLLLTYRAPEAGRSLSRKYLKMLIRSAPTGLLLGCLLLSFSRAAGIAFLGQVFLLALWVRRNGISRKRVAALSVSTLMVALMMFGVINELRSRSFPVQSVSEKVLFRADEGASSITERRDFWKQALSFANERPLFGWGPASFRFVQPRVARDVLATSDHAHNVFLKVAMDSGWPAAILLAAILLWILYPYFAVLLPRGRNRVTVEGKGVTNGQFLLFTGAIGVIAHNLVDYNLQFVAIILPLVLLLGVLCETEKPAVGYGKNKKIVHVFEFVLATLLLCAALREGYYVVTSSLGRRAQARGEAATALKWYVRSEGEWYARDLILSEGQILLQNKRYSEAKGAAERFLKVNRQDERGWKLLAEAQTGLKDYSGALFAYERAYAQGRMVDLAVVRGFLQMTVRVSGKRAVVPRRAEYDWLLKQYFEAFERNAHFILLSRNVGEFVQMMDVMSDLYPDNEPKYQVMAAGVARQAKLEQERLRVPSPSK